MSVCDQCYQPGHCCKRMHVQGPGAVMWANKWPLKRQMAHAQKKLSRKGLPFAIIDRIEPPWVDEKTGREYYSWVWSCPKLDQATGRCTIYETRPDLCRDYEPMSDYLCVHFIPQEAGDPSVVDELPMFPER